MRIGTARPDPVELITDPEQKARREAENGVRQFKAAVEIIRAQVMRPDRRFRLTQAIILDLHQKALQGIHPLAGTYRNSPVMIGKASTILHGTSRCPIMLHRCASM